MFDRLKKSIRDVAKESLDSYYEGRYDLDVEARKALKRFELELDADLEEVKERYRELVKRYHPDNLQTGDNARFLDIQKSFDVIKSAFEKRSDNG
jgi:DnaJ-class molecular chaperone